MKADKDLAESPPPPNHNPGPGPQVLPYLDHALAVGDVREQAELQLPVVRHDQALALLTHKRLADLILILSSEVWG